MNAVTVSTKFQIVIPQAVREQLHVRPGQKMQVIVYNNRVVLIPLRPMQESRGSLKGLNTDVPREEEDRL